MHRKNRFLILIATLLFLTVGQIMAQSDETYTGNVDNNNSDRYVIALQAGDNVLITAIASNGSDLDTILTLLDEDGDAVAENDDYEYPDSTNSQIDFTADDAGDYTVIVSNYPDSSGAYELSITYTLAQGNSSENSSQDDFAVSGFADDDTVTPYDIELSAGQNVVITAAATDGSELDTILVLRDANGDDVAENDDFDGTNSQIDYTADDAGTYTILVGSYPGTSGDYDLRVTFGDATSNGSTSGTVFTTTPQRAPDETYTGSTNNGAMTYTVNLDAGEGLIAALYNTDGEMDTFLYVVDPNGTELVVNDDRQDYETLDSQIAFIAQQSGEHTLFISNIAGFAGDYRLEIYYVGIEDVLFAEQALRVPFSGAELIYDTENFRIHYTEEGVDASDFAYVELVAATVEDVLTIQIEQFGWVRPPSDITQGGDGRYDVYLANQDGLYGFASTSSAEGDNEYTPNIVEEGATAGYLVLDNDYSHEDDPVRALMATTAHEFHHVVQFGYGAAFSWYSESTASWIETITYPEQELASIYVESAFTYPEACIGGEGDERVSKLGVYGSWLFFDFMARNLGSEAPLTLWDNIAIVEGWEALEDTLADYDETVPSYFAQYHVNNLMRDYGLVDSFGGQTVWLEQIITGADSWRPRGLGIQELGANYFALDMAGAVYNFSVDNNDLELYLIGIDGDRGYVHSLGQDASVDTSAYDTAYLMILNTNYDDDMFECVFTEYAINVAEGGSNLADVSYEVDASNFLELGN
ncbi:MAG: MXAN_6640 family putative metalloprotease [Phototrophicaceae bacterium]